jgi:uncharacterized protein
LEKPSKQFATPSSGDFLRSASVLYLLMAVIGSLIAYYLHDNFATSFVISTPKFTSQKILMISVLLPGILLAFSHTLETLSQTYNELREMMTSILGPLPFVSLIYLALISAVGEELLFRGAIQPFIGIFWTSLLFGLLHIGPTRQISSWTLWAAVAGLLFGWSYQATTTLVPAIMAHFLVNAYSMIRLRMSYLGQKNIVNSEPTEKD